MREIEREFGSSVVAGIAGIADLDHAGEELEVDPSGVALDAEQLGRRLCALRVVAETFQLGNLDRWGFHVVSLQHGALVANLTRDQTPRDSEAKFAIVGEPELLSTERDVASAEALGNPVEPSALREIGYRHLIFAQGLEGLGRELNVAE